jgi:hypothetical protein
VSAAAVLSLAVVSSASGGEWESLRDRYDKTPKAHAARIAEIEGRPRAPASGSIARADKLTRDRIAGVRGSQRGDGKARQLADAAERVSRGAGGGLEELSRAQAVHVDLELREWGADGPARRELRESMARLQANLERSKASQASAVDVAVAAARTMPESGASEVLARVETGVQEAGDRIRARWLNQQAALERERVERERAAAERARGLR